MADTFSITYYASRDALGVVSDEEYLHFKELLVEALQSEWPDAQVSVEDDEDAVLEVDGIDGQAEQDVRDRVADIVVDLIDAENWREETDEFMTDEEDFEENEDDEEY